MTPGTRQYGVVSSGVAGIIHRFLNPALIDDSPTVLMRSTAPKRCPGSAGNKDDRGRKISEERHSGHGHRGGVRQPRGA